MCAGIAAYAAYGFGASHAGWAAMGGVFIAGWPGPPGPASLWAAGRL